ncbi:hypothetical protein HYALB_00002334 [Hymenoscyphus albidus]|uniref:Uncharacterized protein n=1 Tax=Hymenoscyphus albidus TaxID=595503 RepID=A0A9N9M1X7_9HELO|nr:hypothetical protein HYALB_00002334 [Hymenoscyphus albidus]
MSDNYNNQGNPTGMGAYNNSPFYPYEGNQYDHRIQPGGHGYRYANKDGSWDYRNADGSSYHDNGKDRAVYTDPYGKEYVKESSGANREVDEESSDKFAKADGGGRAQEYDNPEADSDGEYAEDFGDCIEPVDDSDGESDGESEGESEGEFSGGSDDDGDDESDDGFDDDDDSDDDDDYGYEYYYD